MTAKKMLMSIGTAIAASRLAHMASGFRFEDVLGTVGLSRRRSHVLENLLFLGAGAAVGAGVALLVAPMSGRETRARIGKEVSKLTEAASDAMRETTESARALLHSNEEGPKNSKRATT
ncbi:MAG TPA: YtxH domain-containing protein [Polyangiaceae bacterium]